MNDEQIISSMVKGRECCRNLVNAYEQARKNGAGGEGANSGDEVSMLEGADGAVTKMLSHMSSIPGKPQELMIEDENKKYAARLLGEIRDLLERAMIMEREFRNTVQANRITGRGM